MDLHGDDPAVAIELQIGWGTQDTVPIPAGDSQKSPLVIAVAQIDEGTAMPPKRGPGRRGPGGPGGPGGFGGPGGPPGGGLLPGVELPQVLNCTGSVTAYETCGKDIK